MVHVQAVPALAEPRDGAASAIDAGHATDRETDPPGREQRVHDDGDELAAQEAATLPDREAMSSISLDLGSGIDNFAMPINEATAINYNSMDSYAIADADQIVIVNQVDQD